MTFFLLWFVYFLFGGYLITSRSSVEERESALISCNSEYIHQLCLACLRYGHVTPLTKEDIVPIETLADFLPYPLKPLPIDLTVYRSNQGFFIFGVNQPGFSEAFVTRNSIPLIDKRGRLLFYRIGYNIGGEFFPIYCSVDLQQIDLIHLPETIPEGHLVIWVPQASSLYS